MTAGPVLEAVPDDETVSAAIEDYARTVQRAYGARLKGIYLFGSRARGDHTRDSDADIAVVLQNEPWDFWAEKIMLSDAAYPILVATGVHVQGWPVHESDWLSTNPNENAALIAEMRRDGRKVILRS